MNGESAGVGGACEACGSAWLLYPGCLLVGSGLLAAVHYLTTSGKSKAFTQMPLFSIVGQLVSQVQIVAVLGSFDMKYPDVVENMLSFLGVFVFNVGVFQPGCYFGYSLGARYAPGVTLPALVVLLMVVPYFFSKMLKSVLGTSMAFHQTQK